MNAKGPRNRLEFLTRNSSAGEWRLLAAPALERELGLLLLQRLAAAFGISAASRSVAVRGAAGSKAPARGAATVSLLPSLERWRESGLLVEAASSRAGLLPGSEPVFAVHTDYRQLILRR